MRFTHSTPLIVLLALAVLLAACAAPTAAPTLTPAQPSSTPEPTFTFVPTETPQPAVFPSPFVTATETPLPTATLAPTADMALSEAKLIGLGWYDDYDLLLSFQFSKAVDPQDYRVMLEDKEYRCEVLAEFPDRLYCKGQGAKVLAEATVRVFQAGSDQPGFEKKVWVPFFSGY